MKITYWSDYACPYCYIGEARLKQAIEELGLAEKISWEMKAFQLDPYAPEHAEGKTITRFAQKYGMSEAQAAAQVDAISELGHEVGLEFNYATTLFTNTMDAHRLTKFVRETAGEAKANEFIDLLFHSYFAKNEELADQKVLLAAITQVGLDAEEAAKILAGGKYRAQVLADEREAYERGIHAVPNFLINDIEVHGAMSVADFKDVLLAVHAREKLQEKAGVACGPEGCSIR